MLSESCALVVASLAMINVSTRPASAAMATACGSVKVQAVPCSSFKRLTAWRCD
jgi:hypothetical protein